MIIKRQAVISKDIANKQTVYDMLSNAVEDVWFSYASKLNDRQKVVFYRGLIEKLSQEEQKAKDALKLA